MPAWQAKLTRAEHHLDDIKRQVNDYLAKKPCTVTEVAVASNSYKARLILTTPPPEELSLTIGDCVHNIRSALDAIAYEIAETRNGGKLAERLETVSAFPICTSPTEFDRFFNRRWRSDVFDAEVQRAFREAQPFAIDEQVGKAEEIDQAEYDYHPLVRLNLLWNIDKHRRIPVVGFVPGLIHWGADGEHQRRVYKPPPGDPDDVILYIHDDPATKHLVTDINYDLQLQLLDDKLDRDLVQSLQHLYSDVKHQVIPRLLASLGMTRT